MELGVSLFHQPNDVAHPMHRQLLLTQHEKAGYLDFLGFEDIQFPLQHGFEVCAEPVQRSLVNGSRECIYVHLEIEIREPSE